MLDQVILRLIEICKEKKIIFKNNDDIKQLINILSTKTSLSIETLNKIFYKKNKTIRIDLLNQICKDLNISMDYFFNSDLFK